MKHITSLLLPLLLVLLSACASSGRVAGGGSGHLLIVGGGTNDENAMIYGRFLALAGPGGRIGVVPTASGVENPGSSTAQTLSKYVAASGGPPRVVEVIPIYKDTPEKARDPAIVAQIRSCRGLWFVGGAQSRIIDVFRPGGVDTPAAKAAREVLASGGVIAGTSAGAAMMSDPMIRNGSSANAIRFGVTKNAPTDEDDAKGVGVGPGMGFFPYGFTDQHFLQRGRLGRLIVALEATGQVRGFGVAEDSAMDVDLSSGRIEALGPAAVLVVDRSQEQRDDAERRNIRVSLLNTGDRVDTGTGLITATSPPMTMFRGGRIVTEQGTIPQPWARNVVTDLIRRLADDHSRPCIARDDVCELSLSVDGQTRFFAGPVGESPPTAVNVRLDLAARR